jgi:tRNA(adenine34) deaminase
MSDTHFMGLALAQAQLAFLQGEVPVGAVLVRKGEVIATGFNACIAQNDPTAHAEMQALQRAGQLLGNYRLEDCELFVTLEPCAMCSGALLNARLKRVVFGADEPKTGAAGSVLNLFANPRLNHQTQVQGRVMASECAALVQTFFKEKRESNKAATTPLRDDALRTPEHRFAHLDLATWTPHHLRALPSLRGLRLHYLDEGPQDAPQTTLCLHDFEQWGAVFYDAVPELLAAGKRVLVPDLMGFGKSDKPKKEGIHTLAWQVQILRELLEHLGVKAPVLLHTPKAKPLALALFERLQGPLTPSQLIEFKTETPARQAVLDAPYPDQGHRAGPRALAMP